MIKNEVEYSVTRKQLRKFRQAYYRLADDTTTPLSLRELEGRAIKSMIDELKDQVEEYERTMRAD